MIILLFCTLVHIFINTFPSSYTTPNTLPNSTHILYQLNLVNLTGSGDRFIFKTSKSSGGMTGVDLTYTLPLNGDVYYPLAFHLYRV